MNDKSNKDYKNGRWPPTRCEMPDLSDLSSINVLNLILSKVFLGAGPKDQNSSMRVNSFVRILDKTTIAYEDARFSFIDYINSSTNALGPIFRTVDHLETCINSLNRAIKFAVSIKKDKNSPPLPKNLEIFSSNVKFRIGNVRNAIEHMDEKIRRNQIQIDDPIALIARSDSLEIAGEEISYSELASWIRELNSLAVMLINYREE